MANLQALQEKRKNLIAEIQRRGGKSKAPQFAQQLAALDQQLSALKQGGGNSSLDVSDPNAVIGAQQDENAAAARRNFDMAQPGEETNPFGRRRVIMNPDGTVSTTWEYNDEQQGILDQEQQLRQQGNEAAMRRLQEYSDRYGSDWQSANDRARQVADERYGRNTAKLEEQFGKAQSRFDQDMANRGIPVGSKLYNDQLKAFNESKANAYEGERLASDEWAGQESARLFAQDSQRRAQDFGDISGFLGLGMGVQNPGFSAYRGATVDPTNVSGLAMGYYGLGQEADQFGRNLDQQRYLTMNAPRGGGGDPFALSAQEFDQKKQLLALQNMYAQQGQNQPGFGSALGSAAGSAVGGFFGGLGQGIGQGWGKAK
ncbi:MAG: hypothetical protein E6Q97_00815 [Desulfurellales bacterium]|nr:MAG: hypothetical protein E6Q97_00815 [Desulfurellales bacterium]